MKRLITTLLIFNLLSCNDKDHYSTPNLSEIQLIAGRDNGDTPEREELYRIKVPKNWQRVNPPQGESLTDTTKSLCEFFIQEGIEKIRITVHNFPSMIAEQRIPPIAQIMRWKRQFEKIDPINQSTIPQSFSGYSGILFEGMGRIQGEETAMIGWALQLGSDQYRMLSRPRFPLQMRADVTIKAIGPANLMGKHREEIILFARSFELIQEIPQE